MNKQHVTIHDIARELNISASTVSRALNDHPRISKSTREAVQKLAASYNYQPNIVASSLRKGQSKTVGVIVPRINRNFFSNAIGGMEEVLAASGYNLMICQTHEQVKKEVSAIQTLINARVEAIILSISMETINTEHIRAIEERGIRLLFFDRIPEGIDVGSVTIDNRLGAYLNVKHLLQQGYKQIVHVAGAGHINIYQSRKQGYLDAMSEAGIDVQPDWIIEESLILEGGEAAYRKGKGLPGGADAYFCSGDFAALGVLQAALRDGMRVPQDLGITGFANEPFTAFLEPSLTTVDQRSSEMGRNVAEMFLQSGNGDADPGKCEKIELKPQLIQRKSSSINN